MTIDTPAPVSSTVIWMPSENLRAPSTSDDDTRMTAEMETWGSRCVRTLIVPLECSMRSFCPGRRATVF